jgi:hypothetical protein
MIVTYSGYQIEEMVTFAMPVWRALSIHHIHLVLIIFLCMLVISNEISKHESSMSSTFKSVDWILAT